MRPRVDSQRVFVRCLLVAAAAVALLIGGCGSLPEEPDIHFTPEIARLVSHVSESVSHPDDPIRIRFVDSQTPVDSTRLVSFSPSFKFDPIWEDGRTLSISPRRPLEPGVYRATIDIASITGDTGIDQPLVFDIVSAPTEIVEYRIELEPYDDTYVVKGEFEFSSRVVSEVSDPVGIRLEGRRIAADLIETGSDRKLLFRSEPIARETRSSTVLVSLDSKALGLAARFQEEVLVPAADEFVVVDVDPIEGGGFRLELSDAIDANQLLDGLLRVDPPANASVRSAGRELFLLGDFTPGDHYAIEVSALLRNEDGENPRADQHFDVVAPNLEPAVEFLSDGVFLPSTNRNTLGFRTMNLREVHLRVVRVFENNIGQFLQTESLSAGTRRTLYFNGTYLQRVGVEIADETLTIGETRNQWVTNGIDLAEVFDGEPRGLYVVSLRYEESDVTAKPEDYYFRYWENTVFKPVASTDIGITYKKLFDEDLVFVTDVIDASPMAGVSVELLSYQHQRIDAGVTDANGFVSFPHAKGEVFYVVAEEAEQRSVIKLNEMGWNLSSFDSGGTEVTREKMRAFIYSERGVYRPGDPIHLSIVLRNADATFPDRHPISVSWFNPLGQLVTEYSTNDGTDGLYSVVLETDESDPTGDWRAMVEAGDTTFNHTVKIETVVPFTLKVELQPRVEELSYRDSALLFDIDARYLFGAPASNLEAEATLSLDHRLKRFDRFPGFTFTDEAVNLAPIQTEVYRGVLDPDGNASVSYRIPALSAIPSALEANITARVLERGGRPNTGRVSVPYEPYDRYVGLEKPELRYGYARMGRELSVRYVLVDNRGNPVAGRPLRARVYKNESYWWWEYDSRSDFRLHYKSDSNTTLVSERTITSGRTPFELSVTPEEWGEYYVEVTDPARPGHTAGFFFRSSWWGASAARPRSSSSDPIATATE